MRLLSGGRLRLVAGLLVLLMCAGCSASFQLDSLTGHEDRTGQIGARTPVRGTAAEHGAPTVDLTLAKATAAELFAGGRKDASLPWEDPETGARGTVTALASGHASEDGSLCREFLASHVQGSRETWYQGVACRRGQRWEPRDLRPLQRT